MEQKMRTYQIELKRTSYINIIVDADDMTEAEALAWKDIENNCVDINDADWELEFIEEWKV
jgi:hypothetical protein